MEIASPENCPKYDRCSCNLCPLDPHIELRSYDPDDPGCLYKKSELRELGILPRKSH